MRRSKSKNSIGDAGVFSDKTSSMRTVKLARQLRITLARACPNASQSLVSALAVDLADIREIGLYHDKSLRQLKDMHFPDDLHKAEDLLIKWVEVQLLFHSQWHLNSLKRNFPKMLSQISRELDTWGRTGRSRVGNH